MGPSIIPDVVAEQTIRTLAGSDHAQAAAELMVEQNVSAILVADSGGALRGIVTERDLSRRVVAFDRKGSEVRLEEIMTADPTTVAPDDSAADAMDKMRRLRIRHLPVVDDGKVVGIVSIRDLRNSLTSHVV